VLSFGAERVVVNGLIRNTAQSLCVEMNIRSLALRRAGLATRYLCTISLLKHEFQNKP
jgi:hypothetical protein